MIPVDPAAAASALEVVLDAFPAAQYPQGTPIGAGGRWYDEAGALHTYLDPESAEVERFLGGRTWTELEPEALLGWSHANVYPTFTSPAAHAYYLPAFLRLYLTEPEDGYAITILEADALMWTPPAAWGRPPAIAPADRRTPQQRAAMDAARADRFQAFHDALTAAQRSALAATLEVFEPAFEEPDLDNPARRALDACWRRYARHR